MRLRKFLLMKNDVINDLYDYGYKIVQNDNYFKFSLDSILLSDFVKLNFSDKNLLDMCSGNCPIPIILSSKINNIVAFEIQKEVFELGIRSIDLNGINNIKLINDDVKNINNYYEDGYFDIVTCNPPYFKLNDGSIVNDCFIKAIARHEVMIKLSDIIKISYKMLRDKGRLFIVYRTDRLIELIDVLRVNKFGIRTLQFCYHDLNCDCSIVLVEAMKNGKDDLKINCPIFTNNYRRNV